MQYANRKECAVCYRQSRKLNIYYNNNDDGASKNT